MTAKLPYLPTAVARDVLTEDTFVLHCTRPEDFSFTAGQHVSLAIGSEERSYSIISGEKEQTLSFLIKQIKAGRVSKALKNLPLPAKIPMGAARGYFTAKSTTRKSIFIATGTGIAPFLAMIRSGTAPLLLLQGASRREELYFEQDLAEMVENYQRCLSREKLASNSSFHRGHVTDYLREKLSKEPYDFYLCGLHEMIKNTTHVIDELFPDPIVYTEGFS